MSEPINGEIGFEAPPTQLTMLPAQPIGFDFKCDACGLVANCPCMDEAWAIESAKDAGWKIYRYGPHWCRACAPASECLNLKGLQCDCLDCLKRFGPLHRSLRGKPLGHWGRGCETGKVRQG